MPTGYDVMILFVQMTLMANNLIIDFTKRLLNAIIMMSTDWQLLLLPATTFTKFSCCTIIIYIIIHLFVDIFLFQIHK